MSTFIKSLVEGEALIGKTKGKIGIAAAIGFAKGLQPAVDAVDRLFQENKILSAQWQDRFDKKMAEFDASNIALEGLDAKAQATLKTSILERRQNYVRLAADITAPPNFVVLVTALVIADHFATPKPTLPPSIV